MEVFICSDREEPNTEMPDDSNLDLDSVATDDRSENVQYSECEQSEVKCDSYKYVRSEFDIPESNTEDERSDALSPEVDVPQNCSESTQCGHEANSLIDVLQNSHPTRVDSIVSSSVQNIVDSSLCDMKEKLERSVAANELIEDCSATNFPAAQVLSDGNLHTAQIQLKTEIGDCRLEIAKGESPVCENSEKQSSVGSGSAPSADVIADSSSDSSSVDAQSAVENNLVAEGNSVLEASMNINQSQTTTSDDNNKKKGFRVRFDDDRIVSSYLEPLLPWQDGK
jgi:hypothetical protein